LKIELELKAEKENAEVRIENVEDFQSIVDAEWRIIYEKLEIMHKLGADIVLSKLPIGDLATQWFADRGIFCAGRVPAEDLNRVSKATGAVLQTTVHNINENVLGTCGTFEEKQIGAERFNLFEECPSSKTATIVLRGGAEQFIK
jgi:T-complex protein 1 subunit eta